MTNSLSLENIEKRLVSKQALERLFQREICSSQGLLFSQLMAALLAIAAKTRGI
jgi:hypothetical protein